jgi:hypothetical protein
MPRKLKKTQVGPRKKIIDCSGDCEGDFDDDGDVDGIDLAQM